MEVKCPLGDAVRSVAGWFVVALLLLLRKANRRIGAWAVLVPLVYVYLALGLAERQLNAYLIFHIHQYICSAAADLLRYFALGLAILLAIADRLDIPWRPVRFGVVFLFLLLCADLQIAMNAWPLGDASIWVRIFGVILLLFMLGHGLVHAVLRRALKPGRFGWWYGGVCLALGLAPMLVLAAVEAHLSRSAQLQSTQEQFRVAVVFASGLSLPYLVFVAFVVLALRNPLYRDRLARAFGVTGLSVVGAQRRRNAPTTETSVLG